MPKPKPPQFFNVPRIPFEGPKSANPLAFRHYNPAEMIDGRTLKEHLRFSIAYWHSFRGVGSDPFGPGTIVRPWEKGKDPISVAKARMDAAFEFFHEDRGAVLVLPRPRHRAGRARRWPSRTATSTRSSPTPRRCRRRRA